MPRHDRETFGINLEALPGDVPPAVRLKQALKIFLRRFGLRCTWIGPALDRRGPEAVKPTDGERNDPRTE